MGRASIGALLIGCALGACGGAEAPATARPDEVDPPHFILAVGAARTPAIEAPAGDADALRQAVREARGPERREATRRAAIGLMYAAESASDEREKRRLRRDSNRYADNAVRGSRDEFQNALMEFVKIYNAWRAATPNAARLAERFTTRRNDAGELYSLMWAIRGEIAFELQEWEEAAAAYRYYLGQLDHPLYAYGLWRTASCYRELGREEDATQALTEARDLGCDPDADAAVLRVAAIAGRQVGTAAVHWPDGSVRPGSCPVPGAEAAADEGTDPDEWAPPE